MVIASCFLVFCSLVCLVLAMLQGVSTRQRIHERVYEDVAQDERPTLLSRLSRLLQPINRQLPTGRYNNHIDRRLGAAGLRITPMQFLVLQEIGLLTGVLLYVVTMGTNALNAGWLALVESRSSGPAITAVIAARSAAESLKNSGSLLSAPLTQSTSAVTLRQQASASSRR